MSRALALAAVAATLVACVRPPSPAVSAAPADLSFGVSGELAEGLRRFGAVSAQQRAATPTGAPMPAAHAAAWAAVLDLTVGLPDARAEQLAQARLALEEELEADGLAYGDIPAAVAERVPATLALLSRRLAQHGRVRRVDPRHFCWPTTPVAVNSPWGDRVHPIAGEVKFHAGVDLAAEAAQPVHATGDGRVVFSGWNGAHGQQVEVQHDAHFTTRYSHLMTRLVDVGREVKQGEVLGLAGATGQATGPHLHFELRVDGASVDPEAYLPAPPLDQAGLGARR